MNDRPFLPHALVLAAGLVLAASVIGAVWRGNHRLAQSLDVSGSARQDITADFGIVRFSIRGEGETAEMAYRDLRRQGPALQEFVATHGFSADSVTIQPVMIQPISEFTPQGQMTGRTLRYHYRQRYELRSRDVARVARFALELAGLVEQGVQVEPEQPEYHFTRLAEIKGEVQAAAARDAMERARSIAEASGARLGAIRRARMGVLQITPKHSTMVADYGVNDLTSIDKEITATAHASFAIR
jgi:hypothetical protein